MIDKSELIKYFLLEAEEHVNTLIEGTEELETKGYNKETIESLFRATHTLKGSASIVKFNKVATLSHRLEDLFEALLNEEINYENSLIYPIKQVINAIVGFVNKIHKTGEEKSELDEKVIKSIENILHKKQAFVEEYEPVAFKTFPVSNTVRVELEVIDHILTSLGETLVQKN
ncbi:MAG: Hpt domain-containing protein, partial [Thermodesulfovibrio sp.]